MALCLHNTLTRELEELEPLEPGRVRMYTCGPTVYSYAHIGNLRFFASQDLIKRYLKWTGLEVVHVMNVTDVEDKIIRACRESGESLPSLTGRYIEAFLQDFDALGIERPDLLPRATEHIDEMVRLIQDLIDKGHAYKAEDGSVYFKLQSFPGYGKLSHFDVDQLQTGASGRVDVDEYTAENARDFALWKAWDEEDGDIYWDTPFG
jgi:cysteinyl-tRNA synthetase